MPKLEQEDWWVGFIVFIISCIALFLFGAFGFLLASIFSFWGLVFVSLFLFYGGVYLMASFMTYMTYMTYAEISEGGAYSIIALFLAIVLVTAWTTHFGGFGNIFSALVVSEFGQFVKDYLLR